MAPVSALRETAKSVIIVDGDGNAVAFTSADPLPVAIESSVGTGQTGLQSTANSSTTPLGASATFTGTGEENGFPDIGCYCVADQDGTLFFDFQDENEVWRAFPPAGFAVTANIPEFHTAVKLPRPTRVRFVNGSVAQGSLALSTFWGTFRQGNAPLNLNIASDADAIIVRALPPDIDLALGRIGGQSEDVKFGGVKGIDAADSTVDVWRFADDGLAKRLDRKTFLSVAAGLWISSDSVSDTDVDITINYLDSDGTPQTVLVNLNGQTPVDVGVTALDSNRMFLDGANSNVGNVYLNTANAHTGGVPNDLTTVLAYMPAGKGQTQQVLDTTPNNFKYRIKRILIYCSRASGAAGSAEVELQIRENGKAWRTVRDFGLTTSSPIIKDEAGLVFDGLTNIRMTLVSVSDTDTNVVGEWDFDLIAV